MKKKKFNILVIIPKQTASKKKNFEYIFPIGIPYISSILKNEGYSVDCANLNHREGTNQENLNKILNNKKYDFVCTGSIATEYTFIKEVMDTIKSHNSKPKIILGGLIITSEPQVVFKLVEPDYAVIGEGEETIIELLESLENKKNLHNLKGLAFRDEAGKIVFTGMRESKNDINKIPYPDYDDFGFEEYLENLHPNSHDYIYSAFDYPRVYPIVGSRGCPFNCTFCYHYNKYRMRSIESIMEELEVQVRKYRINVVLFYDECIAANKNRLFEICERIKKLREELPWELHWYPQLTVHNIDDETLKIMKDSGVAGVSYGFESFSPKVLKSMNKPITPQMIESAFKKTMDAKLTIQANFIFGDVAETKETAKETLDWWKKNAMGQIHLLFVQPYPGSKLYHQALERGIIKDREEFIKNVVPFSKFNLTKEMSDKDMVWLRNEILKATAKYSKFVVPKIKKAEKNTYNIKVTCPYCKHNFTFKNCVIKNKLIYGHILPCRNCRKLFYIVSAIEKIGYKNYTIFRSIRDLQKSIFRKLRLEGTL
ncbi:MAG: radical SAM protein [Candidatus Pacearchaeota archaeon]